MKSLVGQQHFPVAPIRFGAVDTCGFSLSMDVIKAPLQNISTVRHVICEEALSEANDLRNSSPTVHVNHRRTAIIEPVSPTNGSSNVSAFGGGQ